MTKKKSKNKTAGRRKNLWVDFIIYALLLALLIWAGFSFRDSYYTRNLDWQTAYEGSLDETIEAEGLFVHDEIVLHAAHAGILRKAVDSGSRVTAGTVIAYIDSSDGKSYAVTAPRAGVVQFAVDGLESTLSTENYLNTDIAYLFSLLENEALQDSLSEASVGRSFKKDEAFSKLVDNLLDYHIIVFAKNEFGLNEDIEKLTVKLPDGRNVSGSVEESGSLTSGQYYILRVKNTAEGDLFARYTALSFTGSRIEGTVVPYSALIENEDGSYKVFYRKKNLIAEKEVELIGYKDNKAVVKGIEAGTDIAGQPKYARVGSNAY